MYHGAEGNPERLHHLPTDPDEQVNLIDNPDEEAQTALTLLVNVAKEFPEKDGAPIYDQLPAQPWDKKERKSEPPKNSPKKPDKAKSP